MFTRRPESSQSKRAVRTPYSLRYSPIAALGEVSQKLVRLQARDFGDAALRDAGQPAQNPEVGVDDPFDPRASNLYDDVPPVEQCRGVDLGDRGGGDCFFVETAEAALYRSADSLFDQRPNGFERQRWNPVLQLRERVDPVRLQQVAAHREDLPELDRYGADVTQQRNNRLRSGTIKWPVTLQAQPKPSGKPLQAVAPEQNEDLREPLPLLQRGGLRRRSQRWISHDPAP